MLLTFIGCIFAHMRRNGTKYESIDRLPDDAQPVSLFAAGQNTAVGVVYIRYDRYLAGKGKDPGYRILGYMGMNWVVAN